MKVDWKILKANADTERAQLNRILEDIKASIKNEAQATLQAANIQATLLSGEGISGMASAWRETFAKVTQLEGGVNALSQDVTALEVKVYDPATGLDATASAVQAMSVEVDTLSGLVMSSYTLALDTNGYIVGWKFTNDGTTGIVDFRADRFRISAPGSIKSVEFADGLLKSVNATHNLYMGAGFGDGDSLIMWYGSTAIPSEASSSNGLFWIKNDGTAYFGGGLSNSVVANLPVITAQIDITSTLQTRVTQIDGELSLLGTALTDVQLELPGKASTQSVALLQGEINTIDGRVEANASNIRQVAVSSGVTVADSSFEENGWLGTDQFQISLASFDVRTGTKALRIGWGRGFTAVIQNKRTMPVEQFTRLSVGFWGAASGTFPTAGAQVYLGLYFTDFAGNYLDYQAAASFVSGPNTPGGYQLYSQTVVVPQYATGVRIDIIATDWSDGWFHVDDVFVKRLDGASEKSAKITESLTANVGPGGAYAQALLMTDVNGRIAGTRLTNNGIESIFSVLADTSEFVSADGSFTITGGRIITRSGGYMNVEGKPFGVGGDLVEWYGPAQANISTCSRSNAIFFKTNTGIFYAKGMIFSGTITAGGQTLALNATSYTTGTFGTNGGPIHINASFSHSKTQMGGRFGTTKNTIAKGAGTNGGSIELWRRIGGGGWEMVSSANFGGTLNVVNDPDPDIESKAVWSIGGSITYTDNVGGTAAREYEVRLPVFNMQDVVISGSAPVPAATEGRNIGVLTSEG